MADIEVILPKMGESVAEATITTWLKKEGQSIEAEESLVEIATDKVDSEVPSPGDGVIKKIFFQEGDVAKVGDVIAIISGDGAVNESVSTAIKEEASIAPSAPVVADNTATDVISVSNDFSKTDKFYSPLVKNIANQEGVSIEELNAIEGSGQNGRVTKSDLLTYIVNKGTTSAKPAAIHAENTATESKEKIIAATKISAPKDYGDNVEVIEMDRMRKLIAEHMVHSKHTSPHVTSFVEADVTNIVNWRNKIKTSFEKREGEKITFTPIFIQAIVKAIKEFPMINISLDGHSIIKKKDINIGMAAALPSGNLIVPVIKNADRMNLLGLTKAVNDLARRAKGNQLKPDEISGGTYTITNVGSFGNILGTPIINQPQVAIMATGAIVKKPAVIETAEGDFIGIRHKMFLSHSYDHRIVDGALGGMFVRKVADFLEGFDVNTEI